MYLGLVSIEKMLYHTLKTSLFDHISKTPRITAKVLRCASYFQLSSTEELALKHHNKRQREAYVWVGIKLDALICLRVVDLGNEIKTTKVGSGRGGLSP